MYCNIIIFSEDYFNECFNSENESSDNKSVSINIESTILIIQVFA